MYISILLDSVYYGGKCTTPIYFSLNDKGDIYIVVCLNPTKQGLSAS